MIDALLSAKKNLQPCRPPLWAGSGHLQTIFGHLLPSASVALQGEAINVKLENESEKIHTIYLKGHSKVVVYLFHGLGGSSDATYMHRSAILAQKLGHHVFLSNHRGCGKGVGLATRPYHSGRSDDISSVIAFGKEKLPGHKHIAIGFSLSANALLLLAAGERETILPDVAIAINGPIHLDNASIKLTQGLNRIYDKRFVQELRQYVKRNNPQGLAQIKDVKDLRDFDERYTAPIGGFNNRFHYYESCSSVTLLKKINIPTVLLTAKDDPFVSVSDYLKAELSSTTILHVEEYGGHMGYLGRNGLGYYRWLDYALKTYLEAIIPALKI